MKESRGQVPAPQTWSVGSCSLQELLFSRLFIITTVADGYQGDQRHLFCENQIPPFSSFKYIQVSVAQSCPTLFDPMDCSPTGTSVPGILQAKILAWGACRSLLRGIVPTQGLNPGLLNYR